MNDFHTSRDVAQAVLSCNIDGAIMLNGLITEEDIRLVNQRGIPMVFMDRNIRMPGTGCVLIDNGSGTHEQVEYLYHTGHRRIAYMIGYETTTATAARRPSAKPWRSLACRWSRS